MSRTYRKPKYAVWETETQYINSELEYLNRRYRRYGELTDQIKVRKTKEEYERDVAAANARYEEDCRKVRKLYWYVCNKPDHPGYDWYIRALPERYRYYVSKFRYETVPVNVEEKIAEARRDYAKRTRDGYASESGLKTAYKTLSKETVRQAVKRLERNIVKDDDWDHLPYPDTYLGKKHIWDVW